MTQRMSTLTTNPVTGEPMTPTMKTVYRIAFYGPDGNLIRHQEGWPAEDNATPQLAADFSEGAANNLGATTVLVWEDVDTEPAARIADAATTNGPWQGARDFGPDAPPVPKYRIEIDQVSNEIRAVLDVV